MLHEEVLRAQVFHPLTIDVHGICTIENGFYADVIGEFIGPENKRIVVPGFYAGENTWKVRFSPTVSGNWTLRLRSAHVQLQTTQYCISAIDHTNEEIHGALCIDRDNPYCFQFEDGTRKFIIGYECNWLWALGQTDAGLEQIETFICDLKHHGFQQILMNVYAHDCLWHQGNMSLDDYGPPRLYLWGGSNENPDHSVLNFEFFQYYDKVMDLLLKNGLTVHLYLKVYNKMVNWPEKYSLEERMYVKYIVARYQAYPNVIWDFAKETYYEPDHDYLVYMLRTIRQEDGHDRLVTLHDAPKFYRENDAHGLLDFVTLQKHEEFYTTVLLERAIKKWPVFFAELGYEHGPAGPLDVTYGVGQNPEELIERAYKVALAGGYPTYYYTFTAWDVIRTDHIPTGYNYFMVMRDFFEEIGWWRMKPAPEVLAYHGCCLAEPGRQYVVLKNAKERVVLNIDVNRKKHASFWMNIHTGERKEAFPQKSDQSFIGESKSIFTCPFQDAPGILHVKLLED